MKTHERGGERRGEQIEAALVAAGGAGPVGPTGMLLQLSDRAESQRWVVVRSLTSA
jgi:hypothetical protein